MTGNGSHHLQSAYGSAGDPAAVAAAYDAWAPDYDREMAGLGYRHPAVVLALLSRFAPAGPAPVLDAGAGTGLLGDLLTIAGYPNAFGVDISQAMLTAADGRGCYRGLVRADLTTELPFRSGIFAAAVSSGVFTTGHVGPSALDELLRVSAPGAAIVITAKLTLWDGGLRARVVQLSEAGVVDLLATTEPYLSLPGEPGIVPSICLALRRL